MIDRVLDLRHNQQALSIECSGCVAFNKHFQSSARALSYDRLQHHTSRTTASMSKRSSTDTQTDVAQLENALSAAREDADKLRRANETLLQENKIIGTIICADCKDPKQRDLIRCVNEACSEVRCKPCLQNGLSSYHCANVGKEIFSCQTCFTNYPRSELMRIGGEEFLKAFVHFATQAVELRERKRKSTFDAIDPSDISTLVTLSLPCCDRTPLVDYTACCCLTCSFCKSSTCAWCFEHSKPNELGNYDMHEHVKTCPRNPNKGSYLVGSHAADLRVALQSHQARQICKRLKATAIGDVENGARPVHS